MTPVKLVPGQIVLLDGRPFEFRSRIGSRVQLACPETGELRSPTDSELMQGFSTGAVEFPRLGYMRATPHQREMRKWDFASLPDDLKKRQSGASDM